MKKYALSIGLVVLLFSGLERLAYSRPPMTDDPDDEDKDALSRIQETEKRYPRPTPEVMNQWDLVRQAEIERWRDRIPGRGQVNFVRIGETPGQSWVNVGPTNAVFQFNSYNYTSFDTGRPNAILVDPRDPNVVYYAASAGGVWKSRNFVTAAPDPTWIPVTEGLGAIDIGAMAMDPKDPDILYIGNGDPYDSITGGTVVKSVDGGSTWLAPVALTADYGFRTYRPVSIRDIKVDPNDSNNVLVSSRAGLFRSTDGGQTFAWIDLPNGADTLTEATWSITFLGDHSWLVSGVSACTAMRLPPGVYSSSPPSMSCPLGAVGDIWRSEDSGATWTSLRHTAGALPAIDPGEDFSRVTLAAGKARTPATTTVVYAMVGNADLNTNKTLGFWRSQDGGKTWQDATGTLANPTQPSRTGRRQCGDVDVGHGQTWYNQAIAVSPVNDNHVIAGGNLCGIRTLNGTAASPTWENVSHWLPASGETATTLAGPLPYVHADWHTATVVAFGSEVRVFSGNDGGIYSSTNVFDPTVVPTKVVWQGHNKGIVTHLAYAIGSGDPSWGNSTVALTGLQDNGTFMRFNPARPTIFTGVQGGDGIGAGINKGTSGEFYWISTEYGHYFCVATEASCNGGSDNWWPQDPELPTGSPDDQPFFVYYSPLLGDPTGVGFLTNTNNAVWRTDLPMGADPYDCNLLGSCQLNWKVVSPDFTTVAPPNGPTTLQLAVASRLSSDVKSEVYGAVLDGSTRPFAVTSDSGKTWQYANTLPNDGMGHALLAPSSLDFPPQIGTGKKAGDEFVAASSAPFLSDNRTPVPDTIGHLFKTTDRGQRWVPISGAGGPSPLPNVPIYVVKFDPIDAKTLYVGTLIGVYATTNGGATWERFGSGLPMVQVTDLYIAKNQDFIRVSTYGRGLWEIYPSAQAPAGVNGDGDYDRNLQIDWVDLAALASRLGTTPATKTVPLYTYIDDVVSGPTGAPLSAIDEDDLNALLGRFAGQP